MKNKKESFTSRVGLFLLLVTFCLGTIQAQSSKITGYVKDQSGERSEERRVGKECRL